MGDVYYLGEFIQQVTFVSVGRRILLLAQIDLDKPVAILVLFPAPTAFQSSDHVDHGSRIFRVST